MAPSSAVIDEDTVIVLGFALGAVALIVLVFIWILIYCLCCRNEGHHSRKSGSRRYKGISRGEQQSGSTAFSSRHGDLPELPADEETGTGPPLPPGHPANNRRLNSYQQAMTNEGFEHTDPVYAYCDEFPAPRYEAPVVPESHAYQGIPDRPEPTTVTSTTIANTQTTPVVTDSPAVTERSKEILAIPKTHTPVNRELSFANEGYIDFLSQTSDEEEPHCTEQYSSTSQLTRKTTYLVKSTKEQSAVATNLPTLEVTEASDEETEAPKHEAEIETNQQIGSTSAAKSEEENEETISEAAGGNEPSAITDIESNNGSEKTGIDSIDNDIYFDEDDLSDKSSISDNSYENAPSLDFKERGDESDEDGSIPDYENVELGPEIDNSMMLTDNDVYESGEKSFESSPSDCINPEASTSSSAAEVDEEFYMNVAPVPQPRNSKSSCSLETESTESTEPETTPPENNGRYYTAANRIDDVILARESSAASSSSVSKPTPLPRRGDMPSNPPPYDQIVDYGQ